MRAMRDRSDQWSFALRMFGCGFLFFVASSVWPEAMPIGVYGEAAYDIDAETWALGFMAAAGLVLYGVHINGRWRWSPLLRIAGHGFLLAMFAYLVASALFAPFGSVVVIFGGLFFIPELIGFLRSNVRDLAVRYGRR
jgi:hypothetical protein